MMKTDEDLILFLLKEREEFVKLNDYISENRIKNSINAIINEINQKIGKEFKRILVK